MTKHGPWFVNCYIGFGSTIQRFNRFNAAKEFRIRHFYPRYLLSRERSSVRARKRTLFTAGTERSSTSAICS